MAEERLMARQWEQVAWMAFCSVSPHRGKGKRLNVADFDLWQKSRKRMQGKTPPSKSAMREFGRAILGG